jgi:hypothetical protein
MGVEKKFQPVAYAIKDDIGRIVHVEHMEGDAKVIAHGRDIVALFAQPTPVFTPAEYSALREAVGFYLNEWSTQKELMYEESPVCATLRDLMLRMTPLIPSEAN